MNELNMIVGKNLKNTKIISKKDFDESVKRALLLYEIRVNKLKNYSEILKKEEKKL